MTPKNHLQAFSIRNSESKGAASGCKRPPKLPKAIRNAQHLQVIFFCQGSPICFHTQLLYMGLLHSFIHWNTPWTVYLNALEGTKEASHCGSYEKHQWTSRDNLTCSATKLQSIPSHVRSIGVPARLLVKESITDSNKLDDEVKHFSLDHKHCRKQFLNSSTYSQILWHQKIRWHNEKWLDHHWNDSNDYNCFVLWATQYNARLFLQVLESLQASNKSWYFLSTGSRNHCEI